MPLPWLHMQLLLSAPQFNPYYKDYRGREVLDRAISQVGVT